ncbi:MAG: carboxypeptidase-like regulatory domain-containing protein [Lewinellaceae bacterium]|nr:carboxypeptidase-like regulatory domain-containing protein [Lewinellaceae bacterium]
MRSIFWAVIVLFLFIPSTEIFSQKTAFTIVKGKVTDAETKEGLAFVSVAAPGFAAGTRTDENGFYLLRTEQKITQIQFNYLSYKTQLLPVKTGEEQTLDVKMEPSAQQLEEVTIKAKNTSEKTTRWWIS